MSAKSRDNNAGDGGALKRRAKLVGVTLTLSL